MNNLILAIDTSCDETSAAVCCGRRVLSNVISSQVDLHKKYGGVYPALAKRAHQERIDFVVNEALKRASIFLQRQKGSTQNSNFQFTIFNQCPKFQIKNFKLKIDAIAVTQGPGLAIALEVGIKKAKEIVSGSEVPLLAVNHLEGHIYSCLAQNSAGNPKREIAFPALCLIVSGGHTQLVLMTNHGQYNILGQTLDDACGEALDKAAKILKLGYPGGPIIEQLAELHEVQRFKGTHEVQRDKGAKGQRINHSEPLHLCTSVPDKYLFHSPLPNKSNLNFSYSGLKTQFLYMVEKMNEKELGRNLTNLAASFQEACFEQILRKTSKAIAIYQPKTLLCGGGVISNRYLRTLLRRLAKKHNLTVFFPPKKNLITDNAAMIGVAVYYKYQRKEFVKEIESLDREPRLSLVHPPSEIGRHPR